MDRVFVDCRIKPGAFSSEYVFEVKQYQGGVFKGVSPSHYFADSNGNRLMNAISGELEGRVAGKVLGGDGNGSLKVLFIDRTADVDKNIVHPRNLSLGD